MIVPARSRTRWRSAKDHARKLRRLRGTCPLADARSDRSVFKRFRSGFLGKVSPVHFFWGSFDMAVTRFSGRTAPAFARKVPGVANEVMREAYSHEVSSAGFWPGGNGLDHASFYSYAYPVPGGLRAAVVQPADASFSEALGKFLLSYDAVRASRDPDTTLLAFLQSTYEAGAELRQLGSSWARVFAWRSGRSGSTWRSGGSKKVDPNWWWVLAMFALIVRGRSSAHFCRCCRAPALVFGGMLLGAWIDGFQRVQVDHARADPRRALTLLTCSSSISLPASAWREACWRKRDSRSSAPP